MNLNECREQIDQIDSEIIELLRQRVAISHSIGIMKLRSGIPVLDNEREKEIFNTISKQEMEDVCKESIENIYRGIIAESRNIQKKASVEMNINGAAI